ncbi:MAG: regulatory protein RecX [Flavisolibacter sp.]
MPLQKKYLTKEQALQKLRHYCAYQERCHSEVEQKLWDLGVRRAEHDEIISLLIEDDYLNEERFAKQFAGGRFRLKNWGRNKIHWALREKKVSTYSINKAMKEIDQESYHKTLLQLAEKKYSILHGEPEAMRRKKTTDYLLQKGYEMELIAPVLREMKG